MLKNYEVIEEIGEWSYDWHIGALLRRKTDNTLWWVAESGCSCVAFLDETSEQDLTPVQSWAQAVEQAKQEFPDVEVVEFAQRLMNWSRDQK